VTNFHLPLLLLIFSCGLIFAGWPENEISYLDDALIKSSGITNTTKELSGWLGTRIPDKKNEHLASKWIADLGNEIFEVREQATRELLKLDKTAVFELKKALNSKDIEVASRAKICLDKISPNDSLALKTAIIRKLATRDPEVLLNYLNIIAASDELDLPTSEALLDAFTIAIKTNANLFARLESFAKSKNPKTRILIAWILSRTNPNCDTFKTLLNNDLPIIKANAALALLQQREKSALRILAGVLPELKTNQVLLLAGLLQEILQDQNIEAELGKAKPNATQLRKLFHSAIDLKEKNLKLEDYSDLELQPTRILVSISEANLAGKICALNPDGTASTLFSTPHYVTQACAINQTTLLLIERSSGQALVNNIGEVYERRNPLISACALNFDPLGNKFILNRQSLMVFDYQNKEMQNIVLKDCVAGARLNNGDYAVALKDCKMIILNGNNLNQQKGEFSFAPNDNSRPSLGFQIESTKKGTILTPEPRGNSINEYDVTGKVVRNLSTSTIEGNPTIYGLTFTMNSYGNLILGTRLTQTVFELNPKGQELKKWELSGKIQRIFKQPVRIFWDD